MGATAGGARGWLAGEVRSKKQGDKAAEKEGQAEGASPMDGPVGEGSGLVRERRGKFSYRACGAEHPARRLPQVQLRRLPWTCLRCRRY